MREDMFKVIVERPRHASRFGTKPKLRFLDKDDWRPRVTGKQVLRGHKAMHKHLSENLAPLKRCLFKQRGRKWDDVFSDICQHLDTGSTVKMHVREHLDDYVIKNVSVDDCGMHYDMESLPRGTPDYWYADLYVCPNDGRLKESEKLREKLGLKKSRYSFRWYCDSQIETNQLIQLNDTKYLVQIREIWFEIDTDEKPQNTNKALLDILKKAPHIGCYGWNVISKKQLSKKELRKHGLKNGGEYE